MAQAREEAGDFPDILAEAEEAYCTACPWNGEINPLVPWLYGFLELQDAGCPLGRHELRNEHWRLLRLMRMEWNTWSAENAERARRQREREAESGTYHG